MLYFTVATMCRYEMNRMFKFWPYSWLVLHVFSWCDFLIILSDPFTDQFTTFQTFE